MNSEGTLIVLFIYIHLIINNYAFLYSTSEGIIYYFSVKYEVPLTFEFKRKLKDIDRSWTAYLELLATCEVTLLEKKVRYSPGIKENFLKLRNKKLSCVDVGVNAT